VNGSYRNENRCHRWSTADMAFLQMWYGVAPAEDVAAHMGVGVRALKEQARRMGISAKRNRWAAHAPAHDADKRREGYVLDIATAPHTRSARAIVRASRPDGGEAA
jgi:hypothetical protein